MSESKFFNLALKEAKKAFDKNEVPIGAVIVKNGIVLAKAHNLREKRQTICSHAEILALEKACKKLNSWRLEDCDLYVTIEPCIMCTGAIQQARIRTVYFAAYEKKFGSLSLQLNIHQLANTNHRFQMIYTEVKECAEIMRTFFRKRRLKTKS